MFANWQDRGTIAEFTDGLARFSFELAKPWLGLTFATGSERGQLFAIRALEAPPAQVTDFFIRQDQLTARYLQPDIDQLETVMTFCLPPLDGAESLPGELSAIELNLSMQTSLLDARLHDEVVCRLPAAADIVELATQNRQNPLLQRLNKRNAVILRTADRAILVAANSSDLLALTTERSADETRCTLRLQAQNLEKGVIRRFRLLAAITSLADCEKLPAVADAFENSALPLSA